MPRCRLPWAFSGLKIAPSGGVGGSGGYGLSGGGLVSDGRLPCRVLGIGNRLGNFLGSRGRGLLRGVHHGGRGLTRGSDHTVLNALDEFAHLSLLLVVGLDGCGGVDRVLELQVQ